MSRKESDRNARLKQVIEELRVRLQNCRKTSAEYRAAYKKQLGVLEKAPRSEKMKLLEKLGQAFIQYAAENWWSTQMLSAGELAGELSRRSGSNPGEIIALVDHEIRQGENGLIVCPVCGNFHERTQTALGFKISCCPQVPKDCVAFSCPSIGWRKKR